MRCNARFHSNFNSFCCNGLSRSAISCAVPTGGIRTVPYVKRFQPQGAPLFHADFGGTCPNDSIFSVHIIIYPLS